MFQIRIYLRLERSFVATQYAHVFYVSKMCKKNFISWGREMSMLRAPGFEIFINYTFIRQSES